MLGCVDDFPGRRRGWCTTDGGVRHFLLMHWKKQGLKLSVVVYLHIYRVRGLFCIHTVIRHMWASTYINTEVHSVKSLANAVWSGYIGFVLYIQYSMKWKRRKEGNKPCWENSWLPYEQAMMVRLVCFSAFKKEHLGTCHLVGLGAQLDN